MLDFANPGGGGTQLDTPKAAMDPATLAWINAGSNVLGKMLSPGGAPTQSTSELGAVSFDNSGFNVAFAGRDANASSAAKLSPWVMYAGIGAAALLGLVALKKWSKA